MTAPPPTSQLLKEPIYLTVNSELLQSRGNDILGVSNGINADDDLPYATINYANGPGHRANTNQNGIRNDLLKTDMHDNVSHICSFMIKSPKQPATFA